MVIGISSAFSQVTYYSRAAEPNPKAWNDSDSWTLSPDGLGPSAAIPQQIDHVVILSGDSVIIDDINDNGGPAESADSQPEANIGPFAASGNLNYLQKGNITIQAGGILNSEVRTMLRGTTFVAGKLYLSGDLINIGNLFFTDLSFFSSSDDLICTGFSNTRIDIPDAANSFTNDDVYLDHTNAFLCGLGVLNIGKSGGGGHIINLNNLATLAQICTDLTIQGCSPDPPGTCPPGTTVWSPTPPVLSGTGGSFIYIENDIVVIDAGIGLIYGEPFLTEATVSIIGGFEDTEDKLDLPATSGFGTSYNATTGELTISGFGFVVDWLSVLQTVTYENLSDDPTVPSTKTVQFEITDGFVTSNQITRDIIIQAVNDPPDASISGSPGALAYNENAGPVPADPAIGIEDVDNDDLVGATITILPYVSGEDFLDFSDAHSVEKVSFIGGVLTLDQTTTVENYELALQEVTYENTSDDPDLTPRTVSFVINDGVDVSDPWDRMINITAINDPPDITVPLTQNISEDQTITFESGILISINDSDAGSNDIDVTLAVTNGIITVSASAATITNNGTPNVLVVGTVTEVNTALDGLVFSPTAEYSGVATLTIDSDDNGFTPGPAQTDNETVTINIAADNDIPDITVPIAAQPLIEDNTLIFNLANSNLVSVVDPDAGSNDITLTLAVSNGIMTVSASSATVTNDATANVTITGTVSEVNTALNGMAYTPNQHYDDTETLTIDSDDNGFTPGPAQTDNETVTINITPINDPPVITPGAPTAATEDVLYTYSPIVTDPDDANNGTDITWTLTNEPTGMVVSSTGVVTWTPLEGVTTSGTVTLTVEDGNEDLSAPDTEDFTISVTSVNDPPVIVSTAPPTATEEVLYTYAASVSDPDDTNNGSDISWTLSGEPGDMVVSNMGVVTWIPAEGVLTSGPVTVTVEDGNEDSSAPNSEVFTITVSPVNDPPSITSTAPVTASEDIEYAYTATVIDPDDLNNGVDIIWTLTNEPTGMVVSSTGVVTWTPLEGVTTSGTVTLTVEDGDEDISVPDTEDFTITVTIFNDPPVITGSSADLIYTEGDGPVALDNQILISDSDDIQIESAEVSFGVTFVAGEDILAFTDQLGIIGTYDPVTGDLSLTGIASITDYAIAISSITYQNTSIEPNTITRVASFVVSDGDLSSTVFTRNIQIIPTNEAPVFVDGLGQPIDTIRFTIQEDIVSTLCVEVADPESNSVHVESVNSTSTVGSFDVGAQNDLCFTFTPIVNFNGIVYGSITICDDGNPVSCSNAIVEITVTPVNDPPVAVDDQYNVLEDEVVIGNVLDNDIDPDGDILSVDLTLVMDPVNGTIILNSDGAFTFTPEKDFAGEDMFVYRVCDNASPAACSEAEVILTFEDVQDPVVAYQVLTPNDDAFNDTWVVDGIEQFPNNTVQIFDRWSSLVYQMQGYNNIERVWNGESNEGVSTGKLPNGTYFYVINLGNGANAIDGFIELRNE